MAPAILTISGSGGIIPTGTIDINANGIHIMFQVMQVLMLMYQILMLMGMKVTLLVMEF